MKVTLFSDTHTKHKQLNGDLPGGDLLIHAGDFMNSGYDKTDATKFFDWFDKIDNYDDKIFIAGNHDRIMQNEPEWAQGILTGYKTIDYLQDERLDLWDIDDQQIVIYGSPWQPEFYNWAFNLPKGGTELEGKWAAIPKDTDILITHGPAQGHLDTSGPPYNETLLGCSLLRHKLDEQPPKIHVCGHIHGGFGYKFHNGTHYFNASVLNEAYEMSNIPPTFDWDPETNEINFV